MNPRKNRVISFTMMPTLRIVLIVPAVSLLMPWLLEAHAILVRSTPSPNQVVNGKAVSIDLRFNSRVDGKRSRLSLVDPAGTVRELSIDQPSQDALVSHASDLAPGRYLLRWQVLAADGHITRGELPFQAT